MREAVLSKSAYLKCYLDRKEREKLESPLPSLRKLEADYMDYVLEITNNNLDKAAGILNVSPSLLFNRIKRIEVWL